jgi:hypothetical protein
VRFRTSGRRLAGTARAWSERTDTASITQSPRYQHTGRPLLAVVRAVCRVTQTEPCHLAG